MSDKENEFSKKIEQENLRRERENNRDKSQNASYEADAKFAEIQGRWDGK